MVDAFVKILKKVNLYVFLSTCVPCSEETASLRSGRFGSISMFIGMHLDGTWTLVFGFSD